jgi:hypothetical protein
VNPVPQRAHRHRARAVWRAGGAACDTICRSVACEAHSEVAAPAVAAFCARSALRRAPDGRRCSSAQAPTRPNPARSRRRASAFAPAPPSASSRLTGLLAAPDFLSRAAHAPGTPRAKPRAGGRRWDGGKGPAERERTAAGLRRFPASAAAPVQWLRSGRRHRGRFGRDRRDRGGRLHANGYAHLAADATGRAGRDAALPGSGPRGRRFESCLPDSWKPRIPQGVRGFRLTGLGFLLRFPAAGCSRAFGPGSACRRRPLTSSRRTARP